MKKRYCIDIPSTEAIRMRYIMNASIEHCSTFQIHELLFIFLILQIPYFHCFAIWDYLMGDEIQILKEKHQCLILVASPFFQINDTYVC